MKVSFTDNITPERVAALVATFAGVLVAILAMYAGAGIGNVAGAGILAYAAIVAVIAWKIPTLQLGRVVIATGRGTLITAVLTVIVLIGLWRSIKGA
ncbi:hypothetical protein ACIBEA_40355 [Streptomyces sp. NPDC051555]|uniref:hypothetical protein n=1 Tax=Streptomyces sp. NPDC051555 TaxID=3365657 RepID=UPI0037B45242